VKEYLKKTVLHVLQTVPLTMFLSTSAVAGFSSHTKPTTAGSLESVFPLQLSLFYFVEEFRIADLWLLRRHLTTLINNNDTILGMEIYKATFRDFFIGYYEKSKPLIFHELLHSRLRFYLTEELHELHGNYRDTTICLALCIFDEYQNSRIRKNFGVPYF
jgi:hypothetical protein